MLNNCFDPCNSFLNIDDCCESNCFGMAGCCSGCPPCTNGNGSDCLCIDQMRNLLVQLISLYPRDTIDIEMESGTKASGKFSQLLPGPNTNPNAGLLELINSSGKKEGVPICRIASVRITSATYNDTITYLPVPTPAPTGCAADCEAAVRAYLPVGTTSVTIKTANGTIGNGDVLKSEYGVVVLVGPNNSDPTFVSTCLAENIAL